MNTKKAIQIIQIATGIILGAMLVIFIISNKQLLSLKFLQYQTSELWSSAIVLLSFLMGMFIMMLISIWLGFSKYRKTRHITKQNALLEKQVLELKEELNRSNSLNADAKKTTAENNNN